MGSNNQDLQIEAAARILAPICPRITSTDDVIASLPKELYANDKSRRRASERALSVSTKFVEAGMHGRAGASFVIALALFQDRLARAERARLLVSRNPVAQSRKHLLEYLSKLHESFLEQLHPGFPRRLATYRTLERVANTMRARHREYVQLLRTRDTGMVKALLATADLAFLTLRADEDTRESIDALFSRTPEPLPHSAEEWASVASLCIADIASLGGSQRVAECNAEVAKIVSTDAFCRIIEYGTANYRLLAFVDYVTLFGYELTEERSASGPVFRLSAPRQEAERAYRAALIREQMISAKKDPRIVAPEGATEMVSMFALASGFIARTDSHAVEERPFHRHLLKLPDPGQGSLKPILDAGAFYDDLAIWLEFSDWAVSAAEFRKTPIRGTLTVGDLLVGLRHLRFVVEMHTAMLLREASSDTIGLWNSAISIFTDEELLRFIEPSGLDRARAKELIDLLRWAGEGFMDLQYSPIVRSNNVNMLAPRILIASNLVRGSLVLSHSRVPGAGDAFSRAVAELLRTRFSCVTEHRKVKSGDLRGEVDVALVADETLVLLECKHSLAGASPYEHADAWNDVMHAAQQLRKCVTIIQQIGIGGVLRAWFPSTAVTVQRVLVGVVTSTRLFCGLDVDGDTPVRDWASLRNVIECGTVEFAVERGGSRVISGRCWSFWKGSEFCSEDFLDYFRSDGIYLRIQHMFLSEYSSIEVPRVRGLPMLVRTSFIANVPTELGDHLNAYAALGLREVGPVERPVANVINAYGGGGNGSGVLSNGTPPRSGN